MIALGELDDAIGSMRLGAAALLKKPLDLTALHRVAVDARAQETPAPAAIWLR